MVELGVTGAVVLEADAVLPEIEVGDAAAGEAHDGGSDGFEQRSGRRVDIVKPGVPQAIAGKEEVLPEQQRVYGVDGDRGINRNRWLLHPENETESR